MQDSENQTAEIERIFDKALALCEAATEDGSPYLLSKLGKDLGVDLTIYKSITTEKLADFLRRKLPPEYRIIPTGIHNNVLEIARPSRDNVFSKGIISGQSAQDTKPQIPRFNYRFWAAFAVPLKNDRRFLDLNKLTFQDVDRDATPSDSERLIGNDLIPSEDIQNRTAVILGNITKWLQENSLDRARFIEDRKPTERRSGEISMLEIMISSLDQKQLQSTCLSLDVVATLMKKKI